MASEEFVALLQSQIQELKAEILDLKHTLAVIVRAKGEQFLPDTFVLKVDDRDVMAVNPKRVDVSVTRDSINRRYIVQYKEPR